MTAIDQTARDMANRALAMIEAHERVCTERAREAKTWREAAAQKLDKMDATMTAQLQDVVGAVRIVSGRMWYAGGGLIAVLIAIIGYLIANKGL